MSIKQTRQEKAIDRLLAERETLRATIREMKVRAGAIINERDNARAETNKLRLAIIRAVEFLGAATE